MSGCPFCGHSMADHHLFAGNYEQPEPEVSCCNDEIDPRTLTTCGCSRPPGSWRVRRVAHRVGGIEP